MASTYQLRIASQLLCIEAIPLAILCQKVKRTWDFTSNTNRESLLKTYASESIFLSNNKSAYSNHILTVFDERSICMNLRFWIPQLIMRKEPVWIKTHFTDPWKWTQVQDYPNYQAKYWETNRHRKEKIQGLVNYIQKTQAQMRIYETDRIATTLPVIYAVGNTHLFRKPNIHSMLPQDKRSSDKQKDFATFPKKKREKRGSNAIYFGRDLTNKWLAEHFPLTGTMFFPCPSICFGHDIHLWHPQLPPRLAASELLVVMKDSPQPHCPLEFGLMKMNSDLQRS